MLKIPQHQEITAQDQKVRREPHPLYRTRNYPVILVVIRV
jgi:hypothetical protein